MIEATRNPSLATSTRTVIARNWEHEFRVVRNGTDCRPRWIGLRNIQQYQKCNPDDQSCEEIPEDPEEKFNRRGLLKRGETFPIAHM